MTDAECKHLLRRKMREQLSDLNETERERASHAICDLLRAWPIWVNARIVLLYSALPDEPNLGPLMHEALALQKTVALPQYVSASDEYRACRVTDPGRELSLGHYGILEPRENLEVLSLKKLDLILVPGLAFSSVGIRLGRGKGYYDRLLSQASGVKCGVGFDWQSGQAVPAEAHDVTLDWIITPSCCREVSRAAAIGE